MRSVSFFVTGSLQLRKIYAKVDIKALRGIALPWMGGVS